LREGSGTAGPIAASSALGEVKYEIRGQLANHANELEKRGYEIISLNIGNPGLFGFRTPETMRLAMIENLGQAEAYSHQKGIFPAREAVVMQQQNRGIHNVSAEEVFIGNGVSELIDLSLRALLDPGDEVLIPSPDYPLWSAAVGLNGGVPRYYDCLPENDFMPDPAKIRELITDRVADIAAETGVVVLADEIYDQMVYDDAEYIPFATLAGDGVVCLTYSGLSKVYRACGYRVGWCVFGGDIERARDYIHGMELLAALRLCSNVPGQWAVQTALGGFQSIAELVQPGGRLYQSRQCIIERVAGSPYLSLVTPMGAMYAFVRLHNRFAGKLDDQQFALELLEKRHILVAPGSSFNTTYTDHFRITTLPDPDTLHTVFDRIDDVLVQHA
jgi:alanine-synthesizing transaminase